MVSFTYTINPGYEICKPKTLVYLLISVSSSPGNFKKRQTLRDTWTRRSLFPHTRLVFMLGDTTDAKTRDLLKLESHIYQDIVQSSSFMDAYRNLTFKFVMSLKWISEYCAASKYVLKVDDDVFTNMFMLVPRLLSGNLLQHNMIMCYVKSNEVKIF